MLRGLLASVELDRPLDEAVDYVMQGLGELSVHGDVPTGIRELSQAGFRLLTLSNGSAVIAGKLFEEAGILKHFDALLSVEDAPGWKSAPEAYAYAADAAGARPEAMLLVAVHPCDIHDAARAAMRTVWLNRNGEQYPEHCLAPEITVGSLGDLPAALEPNA